MNPTEKAVNTFSQGFNCSQSVFSAFSDELGIDEKTAKKIGGVSDRECDAAMFAAYLPGR